MNEVTYWEPESLIATLVLGAKVRVRGFAECPLFGRLHSGLYKHRFCHTGDDVNQIGRIFSVINSSELGHRFRVRFGGARYGHYAAIELEPVED